MKYLGKLVYITKASNPYYGCSGIVKGFSGVAYYIALNNGEQKKVFFANEFTVV
jgi:ribosomal protein L21E